jgi:uncharacterized membrane protein
MTQFPSQPTPLGGQPGGSVRPHRGTTVLVLGILGLVVCPILGIIAWVMGNGDLREMQAGQMDPTGQGMTKAGKICGMIGVILAIVVIGIWIIAVVTCGAAAVTAHVSTTP